MLLTTAATARRMAEDTKRCGNCTISLLVVGMVLRYRAMSAVIMDA